MSQASRVRGLAESDVLLVESRNLARGGERLVDEVSSELVHGLRDPEKYLAQPRLPRGGGGVHAVHDVPDAVPCIRIEATEGTLDARGLRTREWLTARCRNTMADAHLSRECVPATRLVEKPVPPTFHPSAGPGVSERRTFDLERLVGAKDDGDVVSTRVEISVSPALAEGLDPLTSL